MAFSSDSQDPLQGNSQFTEILSEEEEEIEDTTIISSKTHPISSSNESPSESTFNKENYKLEEPSKSKIYIFLNLLFSRKLLPIKIDKDREVLISCNRYSIISYLGYLYTN